MFFSSYATASKALFLPVHVKLVTHFPLEVLSLSLHIRKHMNHLHKKGNWKCFVWVYDLNSFPESHRCLQTDTSYYKSSVVPLSSEHFCSRVFVLTDVASALTSQLLLVDYPSSCIYSKEKWRAVGIRATENAHPTKPNLSRLSMLFSLDLFLLISN